MRKDGLTPSRGFRACRSSPLRIFHERKTAGKRIANAENRETKRKQKQDKKGVRKDETSDGGALGALEAAEKKK